MQKNFVVVVVVVVVLKKITKYHVAELVCIGRKWLFLFQT